MSPPTIRWDRLRFGVFEADLRSGELRKYGMRIRLQSLPFKLLAILLERAGEVVTREELQERIWGSSVVVDFDHSLGSAVNKIREALGDSAENPRYIETLARRGYRFVAPVQSIEPPAAGAPASPTTDGTPSHTVASTDQLLEIDASKSAPDERKSRLPWKLGVGASVALALVACLLLVSLRSSGLPEKAVRIAQITRSDDIYPGDVSVENFSGLVTDGTRIYFPEIREGNLTLAQTSTSDGEGYPLVMPPEIVRPSLAAVSADGSKFLVQSHQWSRAEEPMWIVPSNGGAAAKVGGVLAHDGTWSPDGHSILYASGHDLFVKPEGRDPRRLAQVPGRAFWLRYSPDGSVIRFTILDPSTRATSLWQVSADGTGLRPVLPNWGKPSAECCGNWTADGRLFVFQSSHDGQSNIWALDESRLSIRSPKPIQITAGPLEYLAPLPSRQPNRLFAIGARSRSQLSRFDPASGRFQPYLPKLGSAGRAEVSEDGTRAAWINTSDGSLWQSKLDGTQRLQLAASPMRVFMMRWSPDGKTLAFMGKKPGDPWKIYVVPQDGGTPEMILREPHSEADPCWTPDGNNIIFGRSPEYMAEDTTEKAIYSLNLKTKVVSTIPGSVGLFSPRLSPDGRYMAAMPLDQRKLMIFDFTTNRWSELADKSADNPTWASDGKSIYFHSFMEEGQPIYRVQLSDHHIDRVVDFRNLEPAEASVYIGLTAKDEPIILSYVWTANVYTVEWDAR